MSIKVDYLNRDQLNDLAPKGDGLLCLIGYNAPCPAWVPIGCPFSELAMTPLNQADYEVWSTEGPVRYDAPRGFAVARVPGIIIGLIDHEQLASQTLEQAAQYLYDGVCDLTEGAEVSLLRLWNYIPDITGEEEGTERYRLFNAGRAAAFRQAQGAPPVPPAASALGTSGDDMLVYFLAGSEPGIAIENPRQVSAYHYPEQYGRVSPSFSRAMLASIGLNRVLFISGTASIVGHESLHAGDVAAQTNETIKNLQAVMAEAAESDFVLDYQRLYLKIYLRHADDLPIVRPIVKGAFPSATDLFLQAEICRPELLVEIEATCIGQ